MKSTVLSLIAFTAAAVALPSAITLKGAASPRYVGAALGVGHLQNVTDPLFHEIAAAEYSGATPENEMKWCVGFV